MNDLISKSELIEKLSKTKMPKSYTSSEVNEALKIMGDLVKEAIESMPIADCWISCKERTPHHNTMVIVAIFGSDLIIPIENETLEEAIKRANKECTSVTIGFIGSDGWYGADYLPMIVTPLYWKPLPEISEEMIF